MKNKEQESLEVKSLIRDFRWSNVKGKDLTPSVTGSIKKPAWVRPALKSSAEKTSCPGPTVA
jgi:hypothetical protein